MDIRERAREACDLFRSAVAFHRAGRNAEARQRVIEATLIVTEVIDEVGRRLAELRERITAVRDTTRAAAVREPHDRFRRHPG
jgi:hypothetical protein